MQRERVRPYPSDNRKLTEKTCSDCGETLPIGEFSWNGRGNWKPYCDECVRKKARARSSLNREWIAEQKRQAGCLYCHEKDPCALLFHHRDPSQKQRAVSLLVGNSRKRIREEIDKCDVLCFNCHAKIHAGRTL